MTQEILFSELYLEEPLVVSEGGKTTLEIFSSALGRELSQESLSRFQPLINKQNAKWTDVVKEGDLLQVLPNIAGG